MNIVSTTHLVLIPSYNTGPKLYTTVREARAQGLQLVGESGNIVAGHRRFPVRLPLVSGSYVDAGDGKIPLDAPLRFRSRGL